ncbi:MAG: hypothetical protein KGI54_08940 [Pseudomonadota bacterium]|nr:hypothetical protein [Pseudomonadota bacterium]
MAIPSRLMGSGLAAQAAVNICGDVGDSLTAAGTTNADALGLTAAINRVTTTAASTGVRLMVPETGASVVVVNSGANALLVYPGTGASINALTVTTGGFSVAAGGRALFVGTSSTNWFAVLSA